MEVSQNGTVFSKLVLPTITIGVDLIFLNSLMLLPYDILSLVNIQKSNYRALLVTENITTKMAMILTECSHIVTLYQAKLSFVNIYEGA